MKTSHLQSMIALNANRITKLHNTQEAFQRDARAFKATITKPVYQKHLDAARSTAFNAASGIKKDIARAVDLQRALQAELRSNQAAEAKPKMSRFFTHRDGYGCGTFCVEVTADEKKICHMTDGESNVHDTGWLSNEDLIRLIANGTLIEHTTRQYPLDVQAPGIYSIDADGIPKKDGVYAVLYAHEQHSTSERKFANGKWSHASGGSTMFGKGNTQGERYIVVK